MAQICAERHPGLGTASPNRNNSSVIRVHAEPAGAPERTLPSKLAAAAPGRFRYRVSDLPPHLRWRITVDLRSGCWITTGSIGPYGHVYFGGRSGPRVIWEALVGPIGPGLFLDHRDDWGCTSNACTNPAHLLPVTPRVNTLRGRAPTAVNARKTHCDSGHPLEGENLYRRPGGGRECRECQRGRVRAYRQRKREALAAADGQPGHELAA